MPDNGVLLNWDIDGGTPALMLPADFMVDFPNEVCHEVPTGARYFCFRRLVVVEATFRPPRDNEDESVPANEQPLLPLLIHVPPNADYKLGPLFMEALQALLGESLVTQVRECVANGIYHYVTMTAPDRQHIRQALEEGIVRAKWTTPQ